MPTPNRFVAITGVSMVLAAVSAPLRAQQQLPTAPDVVRQFAVAARSWDTGNPNWRWPLAILLRPEYYPSGLVEGVLDGLGELALMDPDQGVRIQAATWLSVPGQRAQYPGVIERLEALLEASTDHGVRGAIIDGLGAQADTAGAVRVLERVATEDGVWNDDLGSASAPYRAIRALLRLGEPGRASLERLHSSGTVRDPLARGHLELLASRSFRPIHR